MYSIKKALKNSHLEADGPAMFFQSKQFERIRREADLVLPNYDPRVLERHPGGVVA